MDGFYDGMIFHRIVPDFLIQAGALRQGKKPAGFDSDYQRKVHASQVLERRKYETHSRLRFNHRGQLAMALGVNDADDDELLPQFFITLDEAPYLDGKHVLFGTCSGPTIFNALRIGKIAVDDDNQPNDMDHAPRITACRVVENPIHLSLAPLASVPWRIEEEKPAEKKIKKRKGKKDLKLLSFGDEMEIDEVSGIKSSHDVVSSTTLSKSVDKKVKELATNGDAAFRFARKVDTRFQSEVTTSTSQNEADESVVQQPPSLAPAPVVDTVFQERLSISQRQNESKEHHKTSVVEARLARFKGKVSKGKRQREEATMEKLIAFQSKVKKQAADKKGQANTREEIDNSLAARMARKVETTSSKEPEESIEAYHGQILEDDDNEENNDWMGTRFKCRHHIDHASRLGDDEKGGDGRDMHDYEVIDEKISVSNKGGERHHHRDRRRDGHRRLRK
jgi:peptidyl-prolyl cis-trans isomerase SDCCAG10